MIHLRDISSGVHSILFIYSFSFHRIMDTNAQDRTENSFVFLLVHQFEMRALAFLFRLLLTVTCCVVPSFLRYSPLLPLNWLYLMCLMYMIIVNWLLMSVSIFLVVPSARRANSAAFMRVSSLHYICMLLLLLRLMNALKCM